MTYTFRPQGVCSQEMRVEVDDQGVIRKMEVLGGLQRQPPGDLRPGGGDARPGGHPPPEGNPLRLQAHLLPGPVRLRTGKGPEQTEMSGIGTPYILSGVSACRKGFSGKLGLAAETLRRACSEAVQGLAGAAKFPGQAEKNMVH